MANRNRMIAAGFCLLFAGVRQLAAQGNTADVFVGYSFTKTNPLPDLSGQSSLPKLNTNGWTFAPNGYLRPWFGVGAEITGSYGTNTPPASIGAPGFATHEYSYLFGPQFRFVDNQRWRVGFRFLLGGAHGKVALPLSIQNSQILPAANAGYVPFSETKFAASWSVPVDVTITKTLGWRIEPTLYLTDFHIQKQSWFRFATGPVFRFGGK
jgi:hypothetical protein